MSNRAQRFLVAMTLVTVLVPVAAVQAVPWGAVARGFEAFDYRFSGQRNILGDGWNINLNANYTGQNYDFGFADLTLGPGVSNISMGYTLRGIPSAKFSWNTGGQPLAYTFKINNGIQDFTTVNGNVLIDVSADVNVLGFYDTRVQISNRGTFTTDGYGGTKTGTLAYDVGPIDISGNIYLDILAAITEPLFAAANVENPFAKLSSRAAKTASLDATVEELQARLQAGEVLSDQEMSTLVNSALLSAIINNRNPNQDPVLRDLTLAPPTMQTNNQTLHLAAVPEPSTALLLAGAGLLIARRRRARG